METLEKESERAVEDRAQQRIREREWRIHARYTAVIPDEEEAARDARITQYLRVSHAGQTVVTNVGALTRLVDESWFAGNEYAARTAQKRTEWLEGELKRMRDLLNQAVGQDMAAATPNSAANPLDPNGDDPPHG